MFSLYLFCPPGIYLPVWRLFVLPLRALSHICTLAWRDSGMIHSYQRAHVSKPRSLPHQPSACTLHLQAHLQSVNLSSRSLALMMHPVTLAQLVLGHVAYCQFPACIVMSCEGVLSAPNVRWMETFACGLLACAHWIMHLQILHTNLPFHCFSLSFWPERSTQSKSRRPPEANSCCGAMKQVAPSCRYRFYRL